MQKTGRTRTRTETHLDETGHAEQDVALRRHRRAHDVVWFWDNCRGTRAEHAEDDAARSLNYDTQMLGLT